MPRASRQGIDLVCFFDCLHDMGDPVGAARHVGERLKADGTWLIVEPYAHDGSKTTSIRSVRCSMRPRRWFARQLRCHRKWVSHLVPKPARRGSEVTIEGGFSRFRRAAETPFNLVFEARP